jgi:hypothetical protein
VVERDRITLRSSIDIGLSFVRLAAKEPEWTIDKVVVSRHVSIQFLLRQGDKALAPFYSISQQHDRCLRVKIRFRIDPMMRWAEPRA